MPVEVTALRTLERILTSRTATWQMGSHVPRPSCWLHAAARPMAGGTKGLVTPSMPLCYGENETRTWVQPCRTLPAPLLPAALGSGGLSQNVGARSRGCAARLCDLRHTGLPAPQFPRGHSASLCLQGPRVSTVPGEAAGARDSSGAAGTVSFRPPVARSGQQASTCCRDGWTGWCSGRPCEARATLLSLVCSRESASKQHPKTQMSKETTEHFREPHVGHQVHIHTATEGLAHCEEGEGHPLLRESPASPDGPGVVPVAVRPAAGPQGMFVRVSNLDSSHFLDCPFS